MFCLLFLEIEREKKKEGLSELGNLSIIWVGNGTTTTTTTTIV